ncbi:HAUS augmin-like complex subunit 6 [Dendronephthya gigantea]|uniref:HAUS augmin-like complex subunit 6 n=1 Tax=Dendronephthya gigantea TaxID=151771 RepID=UPI00106D58B0|nr:HAUS augmin-like complex subunit 6 [Dendronephthya gigantea]
MAAKGMMTKIKTNPFDLKEVFYTNLLLLGFDGEAQEAKYRIPFNSDMFVYPNKKAMEVILHFLFCNLDAPLAFQEFRDCWPVQDKKMEQEFRKSCNSWLTRISKEEPDSSLPRIGPSLFLSPGGERFYEVMFYFSAYVLRQVDMRDHSHGKKKSAPLGCKKITKMPKLTDTSSKAMLVKTLTERNRFFENVHCDVETQEHWKAHATLSTKIQRKICKENRELERRLNPTGDKEKSNYLEETEALRRIMQLQEVRRLWSTLESFYENTKKKRAVLNEMLENNEPRFHLDGSSVHIQIPEVLTTKYGHAIQMKNIRNTYKEGKMNMLSLVQLSNLSLHELKERIRQDGIPDFEPFITTMKNDVRVHGTHLAQARSLGVSLKNEFIPELKKSIEKLKEECYAMLNETVSSPDVALDSFDFGLGLLPATPSPAFATVDHLTHSDSKIPQLSLRKTPKNQATPDVIENLTSSIREMVVRDNQQPDQNSLPSSVSNTRFFDTRETPKPFVSKIPKPVNRRLSRTPDVKREKPATTKERSLTSTKKPRKVKIDVAKTEEDHTEKTMKLRMMDGSRKKDVDVQKSNEVSNVKSGADPFRTPLTRKTILDERHSSARNILAEKIAAAVFSEEPSSCAGSSRSSSEQNSPKDLAITDPIGSLSVEPFVSKDLIPRTPFKRDQIFSDLSDEDTHPDANTIINPVIGSTMNRDKDDHISPQHVHSMTSSRTSLSESLVLTTDPTLVLKQESPSPSQPIQQNTPVTQVMSPVRDKLLSRTQTTSVDTLISSTLPLSTKGSPLVSSDLISQYQRLKQAQGKLRTELKDVLGETNFTRSPQSRPEVTESLVSVSKVVSISRSQSLPVTTLPLSSNQTTTNPVLLRYRQWKNAQETSSKTITTTTSAASSTSTETFSDAQSTAFLRSVQLLPH